MISCRRYNAVLDFKIIEETGDEPVTLDEVKEHLNLIFDVESGEGTDDDFNDDDNYLRALIKQCRKRIEKALGVSLVEKQVRAILRNDKGGIELPYGPVRTEVYALVDEDGETIDAEDYKLRGIEFKTLKEPCSNYVDITYDVGYNEETIPEDLKRAILEEIAFRYSNRGDQQQEYAAANVALCESAMELALPYSRTVWLL